MDHQSLLHSLESLLDVNPLKNYTFLFSNLGASHLDSFTSTGRKPFPRESLLRAIIFKNLKGLPSLTELVTELKDNPSAAIRCGFNILRPLPSVERFSSFLKNTHNKDLHAKSASNSSTISSTSLSLQENISRSIPALFLFGLKKTISKPMSKTVSQKLASLKAHQMHDSVSWLSSRNPIKNKSATSGASEIMSSSMPKKNSPSGISQNQPMSTILLCSSLSSSSSKMNSTSRSRLSWPMRPTIPALSLNMLSKI